MNSPLDPKKSMKVSFHGAAQGVTGSCHLVECGGKKILIDCGMFQGGRELQEDNADPFGFEPSEIDFLLLTHAHLDHCGRIPLLEKRGFEGEIIATAATRELARLVMLDSAGLQEEDAAWRSRKAARTKKRKTIEPLYTTLDALNAMDAFGRKARYDVPMTIADGIRATYIDAGHILGSASILLELEENGVQRRVLFSGDLGNRDRPLLRDPADPPEADVVVMESTYGNRQHKALEPSIEELFEAIRDTMRRGGNVVIPTFAVERAQEILFTLNDGVADGRLPASMSVFLDSPMAIRATRIFERHPEGFRDEAKAFFQGEKDPFDVPGLQMTRETAASKAINNMRGGSIIMAGSGMCTGGRVRHHLKHNLWRQDSSVIFVGYATHGTLARIIIDGAKKVRIFGGDVRVRAKVHTIGGFSAHADQNELLSWHKGTGAATTYLVHGDPEVMKEFAPLLGGTDVRMPALHQEFEL
jgi:metallo-beta-lactamase family protein